MNKLSIYNYMKKINLLELIRKEEISELYANVFAQKLPDSTGDGTFTRVLSEDEETEFMEKLISKSGYEADPWLEFIQEYCRHYPLSNKATNVLFKHIDDPKTIPLLIDILSTFGYTDSQGIALCELVLKDSQSPHALRILQLIYERARIFSPDVYRLLEKIDARIHESGYAEQATFAVSYRQVIDSRHQIGRVSVDDDSI